MQRIQIEGIKNDPWFRKNYESLKYREDEEVNLDDVHAVFDDIEVRIFYFYKFGMKLETFLTNFVRSTVFRR